MKVILAIDGGGSRTRCSAIDESGQTLCTVETGASNHLLVDRETVVRSLSESIEQTLSQCGLQLFDVGCISAGLAGVDYDGTGSDEMTGIFRELGFERTIINGDMVIAHAGALAGKPGVIALAGTGSSILGVGKDGERVKVGGWGPVFGDEGSAYRIGQMALRAAARDFDGRGKKTELTGAILKVFGVGNFKEMLNVVYFDDMKARYIAALSLTVSQIAEAGDLAAREILERAGEELAESVTAAIARLSMSGEQVEVSYQGSVLEASLRVRESFVTALARSSPEAAIVPPRYTPVVGAYLLGRTFLGLPDNDDIFNTLDRQEN